MYVAATPDPSTRGIVDLPKDVDLRLLDDRTRLAEVAIQQRCTGYWVHQGEVNGFYTT